MTVVATVVVLAGVVWWLARRLSAAERQIVELRFLRGEIDEVRTNAARDLAVTRAHLASTAAGTVPSREAILEGRPYEDIAGAAAVMLLEREPDLFVLDVRTRGEFADGHIPGAHLIPVDELEEHLRELPAKDAAILVTCAAGGRSVAACEMLAPHGFSRLLNLVGGMHAWRGPRETGTPVEAVESSGAETAISFQGGAVSEAQVVAAIRECYDPEIPLNVYDLGLIYGIDIAPSAIAVRMTLTSEACPSARTIPEDVKRKVAALGQPNVSVEIVWEPPWHPSRISAEGKQKLGLA
jgi:metal-sulfur cluster biosynthetic enzyme/rhodanese-related sulfurtransferase